MLDEYVAPKPMVAGYVRRQLLCNGEESRIQAAILDAQGGQSTTELYSTWLSYSGLDLTDAESPVIDAVVSNRLLLHTLFDLMLGERVKAFILNGYTEIHDVRASIQSFLTAWVDFMEPAADPRSPWWDGIERLLNPSRYWLSIRLRHHSDFSSVFRSWLDDSSHLQTWLARFEEETLLVNNPKDADRVFSESNAMEVMDWAKVSRFNTGQVRLCILWPCFSFRGAFLTRNGGLRLGTIQAGSSKSARSWVCLPRGPHGSHSFSSMILQIGRWRSG